MSRKRISKRRGSPVMLPFDQTTKLGIGTYELCALRPTTTTDELDKLLDAALCSRLVGNFLAPPRRASRGPRAHLNPPSLFCQASEHRRSGVDGEAGRVVAAPPP